MVLILRYNTQNYYYKYDVSYSFLDEGWRAIPVTFNAPSVGSQVVNGDGNIIYFHAKQNGSIITQGATVVDSERDLVVGVGLLVQNYSGETGSPGDFVVSCSLYRYDNPVEAYDALG